jgi:regulatory protein
MKARKAPNARSPSGSGRLLARAIRLLARREHSRAQLAAKLQRGMPDADSTSEIDQVLDRLERDHLLSDERFAGNVARARAARFGDARIRHELKRAGVVGAAATGALTTLKGTELERARAVWVRRFGTVPRSAEERARQARFLQSRGFSTDTIRRILRGLPGSDD